MDNWDIFVQETIESLREYDGYEVTLAATVSSPYGKTLQTESFKIRKDYVGAIVEEFCDRVVGSYTTVTILDPDDPKDSPLLDYSFNPDPDAPEFFCLPGETDVE